MIKVSKSTVDKLHELKFDLRVSSFDKVINELILIRKRVMKNESK